MIESTLKTKSVEQLKALLVALHALRLVRFICCQMSEPCMMQISSAHPCLRAVSLQHLVLCNTDCFCPI